MKSFLVTENSGFLSAMMTPFYRPDPLAYRASGPCLIYAYNFLASGLEAHNLPSSDRLSSEAPLIP